MQAAVSGVNLGFLPLQILLSSNNAVPRSAPTTIAHESALGEMSMHRCIYQLPDLPLIHLLVTAIVLLKQVY